MRFGIRLQLLLALGSVLALGLVPLLAAVAGLSGATMTQLRADSARSLGHVFASYVDEVRRAGSSDDLERALVSELGKDGIAAVAAYDPSGRAIASAAQSDVRDALPSNVAAGSPERFDEVRSAHGERLAVVVVPASGGPVAAVMRIDARARPAPPLVRLVAMYTIVVGLALLAFAYFAMTRLVVQPIERLSRAARRVADGGRQLELPRVGAREMEELGASLTLMTERLRADEEALRRKVEELERATAELRSAQETVLRSERLASVGRLAAGLAHGIGNPIAAILGFEDLLLEGALDEAERRDFLVRMKRETERIHRVLRDLLDFARPSTRPPGDVHPAPCDVRSAAEEVLALVRPQKSFKAVVLDVDISPDVPPVALAHERTVQVLLNLLLNAAEVVPRSGGRIGLRASRSSPGFVRIEVDDNGPGIDAAVRETIFEPFVTTKEVGKGTGLGLAVCRGLVEAVGGTIRVEAADGRGARFVLELPEAGPDSR